MKRWFTSFAVLMLFGFHTLQADAMQGTCDISYKVKATMDSFEGTAACEPITVNVEDGKASWNVTVPIIEMLTGNKKRDKEMYHMFHSEEHPLITGSATDIDLDALKTEEGAAASLPFSITIAGVSHDLVANVTNYEENDEGVSFDAQFDVALKEFGLVPPSVLKIIRVHNIVKVTTAFTFSK